MADFRKWILALAVLGLIVSAVPASAQTLSCVGNPGQPPVIRDGGLAELVGGVLLTCTGGAAQSAPAVTTNIQIFMTTTVSNPVSSSSTLCPTGIACVTDAMLVIDDDFTQIYQGLLQPNLVTGDVPNTRNSILFPNVSIPATTAAGHTIRILNVRVVAPAASNTFLPTQVFELVSTNPVGVFPITNATQQVAVVQPGLIFATRSCDDGDPSSLTFQQCIDRDKGVTAFNLKFTEGFAGAFKTRIGATPTDLNSESGNPLYNVALPSGAVSGVATQGTQLIARFSNIPAGVHIYVTYNAVAAGTSNNGATPPVALLQGTLINVSGSAVSAASSDTMTCPLSEETAALVEVPISGGSGSATWEITGSTIAANLRSISFGVSLGWTANTSAGLPGLTGATPGSVTGNFAPISTVDSASTTAPVPRFRDNPQGATVFNINACVTNLLFPFVTNMAGFDTGIALINTSLDNATGSAGTPPNQPFDTDTQSGACTVYYFDGTANPPKPQTTAVIQAGGMAAFAMSQGGVPNDPNPVANNSFQGYIIARCAFQFGHGFAFISDRNVPSLGSHGYLALVIPDRSPREPSPFDLGGGAVQRGEVLGN